MGQDLTDLRRYVDKRLLALRNERMSYWGHWKDLSDYINPRRGKFLVTPNQGNRGSVKNQNIIDSTGTFAANTLSSGMMAGITSPSTQWFRMSIADDALADNGAVKLWLDECRSRMMRVFARSNFYNSLHVVYEELGIFGTAVMLVEEDPRDIIRCSTLTVGEYMVANGHRNEVDTLYREFTMTAEQMVQRFGLNACSMTVQHSYESGMLDREYIVGHAIEPNDGRIAIAPGIGKHPFRSVYWEVGQTQTSVLEVKGLWEPIFAAPRWYLASNDAYGRSPGMDALGDVKMLQVMQKRMAQAIDKIVNPPMVADVSLKNQDSSLLPGSVTYVPSQAGVGFKPAFEVPPNIQGIAASIGEAQKRIQTCFFYDLWLMISQLDTVRTATEINERKQEKMLMLGPVLERFHKECLNPLVLRTFRVMDRMGLLPQRPPELAGAMPDIEYVSALADAQKARSTTPLEQLAAFVGNLAASKAGQIDSPLDKLNLDEMIDEYADDLCVSPKNIVTDDQVALVRAQRAKAAQQQQAQSNAMAAAQGAQTMSQTDVGGGQNALQMMMGRGA